MENKMELSTKDVGEFFRITLHLGVSNQSEIARWADCLIERQNTAESWQLELSDAANRHPTDVIRFLGEIQGVVDKAEVGKMVFGRLAKEVEENRMSIAEFLQLTMRAGPRDSQLYDLLNGKPREDFFDIVQAWYIVELGSKTKAEFEQMVLEFLGRFRGFDFRPA